MNTTKSSSEKPNHFPKGAVGFGLASVLSIILAGYFGLLVSAIALTVGAIGLVKSIKEKTPEKSQHLVYSIIGLLFSLLSIVLYYFLY